MKVLQTEPCKEVWTLEGHTDQILSLAFAAGNERPGHLGERSDREDLGPRNGAGSADLDTSNSDRVHSLAFSPDGHLLAAGNAEHDVKVLDGTPL